MSFKIANYPINKEIEVEKESNSQYNLKNHKLKILLMPKLFNNPGACAPKYSPY